MPTKAEREKEAECVFTSVIDLANDINGEIVDLILTLGEWRTRPTRGNFWEVVHYAHKLHESAEGLMELCDDYYYDTKAGRPRREEGKT